MQYTLGADQQAPALPFIRLIAPTELDRARTKMVELIKGYHPGVDLLNIALWRKLGLEGGPVNEFLSNYITMARTRRSAPTSANLATWKGNYLAQFPGSIGEDVEDYFNALMQARAAGFVTDTIFEPWDYEPQSVAEDVGGAIGVSVEKGFNKILIAASIVGVIYLLGRTYMARKIF